MQPTIDALRAITALVFQRILTPILWGIGGVIVAIYFLIIYLSGWVHPLWWLLLIILIPLTLIITGLTFIVWTLSSRLIPRPMTNEERKQLTEISDRIIRVAEVRATPIPVLLFLIAKDVIRSKKSSYIESVVKDTTSLKQDFTTVRQMFNNSGR